MGSSNCEFTIKGLKRSPASSLGGISPPHAPETLTSQIYLWILVPRLHTTEHGQDKGSRLASAGLRLCNQVLWAAEHTATGAQPEEPPRHVLAGLKDTKTPASGTVMPFKSYHCWAMVLPLPATLHRAQVVSDLYQLSWSFRRKTCQYFSISHISP